MLQTGRTYEAERLALRIINTVPSAGPSVYALLGSAWLVAPDGAEAQRRVRLPATTTPVAIDVVTMLEIVVDRFPESDSLASLLVAAELREGRMAEARARCTALLPRLDGGARVALAARVRALDPELADMILGDQPASPPDPLAHHRSALAESLRADEPEAESLAWLAAAPADLSAAHAVLECDAAWAHERLVARAISRLEKALGRTAPRPCLGRAMVVLRFHRDDAARVAEAIADLDTVLWRAPDSRAALALKAQLILSGESASPDSAIDLLAEVVKRYPGASDERLLLVTLLQDEGRSLEAREYLRPPVDVDDLDPWILAFERQGDLSGALGLVRRRVAAGERESDRRLLVDLLGRAGEHEMAASEARALAAEELDEPATILACMDALVTVGDVDGAVAQGSRLIEISSAADAEALLARFWVDRGDLSRGRRHATAALELDTRSCDPWSVLVDVALAEGDLDAAEQAALEGLERDPTRPELVSVLATLAIMRGRGIDDALARLDEVGSAEHDLLRRLLAVAHRVLDDATPVSEADLSVKPSRSAAYPSTELSAPRCQ